MPKYIIGIDLGTTHSVVSYLDIKLAKNPHSHAEIFPIEQLIGPGEVAAKLLLPSFRYHAADEEIAAEDCILPWGNTKLAGEIQGQVIIGSWARELGSKTEGRLISSAKSWLCHSGVDRSAKILPWGSDAQVEKVSPVLTSASYLSHIRCAWDHHFENAPLNQQEVIITVPASFDEAARALTLEAAQWAGYPKVLLLEEPQAVCYDWFHRHQDSANRRLKESNVLLVCDVGGGTTDLSLITTQYSNGELQLNRVGVGDHLLLGGDNVDLALAKLAESRINNNKPLSNSALAQLVQQTRKAKELLLSENAPDSAKVTLLGSGSKLIGGAKSAELTRQEVHNIALDGFFPLSPISKKATKSRSAVVEFGLPYTSDPAISHHIADFINANQTASKQALDINDSAITVADTLLLNGGVFNSEIVKKRICEVISNWSQRETLLLENGHPDLAVAHGAVAYGKSKHGKALKIGGGSARSFFLKVDTIQEDTAVCLLQKGAEEEIEYRLSSQQFVLTIGKPVQFHLYSSSADNQWTTGNIANIQDDFLALPPLVTALPADDSRKHADGHLQREVQVELITKLTEVGTIQLEAAAIENDKQRWLIEFEIRKNFSHRREGNTQPHPNQDQVEKLLLDIFGPSKKQVDLKTIKNCRNQLEKILGKREAWDTNLLRSIATVLLEHQKRRRRSEQHERLWINLMGYCARPGYGHPLDEWRMQQLTKLYNSGLQFDKTNQAWAEWWTLWRRIAGGLNPTLQSKIAKDIGKFINPASARNSKLAAQLKNRSYEDILRLIGCLEHLPIEQKQELATWCIKRLTKSSETPTCWWTLGRIGARELAYGSAHTVIPTKIVEAWIKQALLVDWKKNESAMLAAVLMSKKCDDRTRDISDELRKQVIEQLQEAKAPKTWIQMTQEITAVENKDQKTLYGDSLPPGIRLVE